MRKRIESMIMEMVDIKYSTKMMHKEYYQRISDIVNELEEIAMDVEKGCYFLTEEEGIANAEQYDDRI